MKNIKKRKKGFTLLEIGAVLGIIMLLIGFFVPKISGYLKDAKDVSVMAQAKTVVFAWETVNYKGNKNLSDSITKAELISATNGSATEDKVPYENYFDLSTTKNLDPSIKVSDCLEIINGKEFVIDKDGIVGGSISSGTR